MIKDNDKISSWQVGIYCIVTLMGVGMLTLPSGVTKVADNDGWLIIIASGLINVLMLFIISSVLKKYGNEGYLSIIIRFFGGFFGRIIIIPVLIYLILFCSLEVRFVGENIKTFLLESTPIELLMFPMVLISAYLVRKGIEPLVRLYEILFPVIITSIILFFLLTLPNSDYSNLLPPFKSDFRKYISSAGIIIFPYLGYEILLILSPNLSEPKKIFKPAVIAIGVVTCVYLAFTIQCIARLGVEETKALYYPVISMIKASDVPGAFLERVEGIAMVVWVIFAYTTLTPYYLGASIILKDLMGSSEIKYPASILFPVVYLLALMGNSIEDNFKYTEIISLTFGTYSVVFLPVLILIFSFFKRKGEEQ